MLVPMFICATGPPHSPAEAPGEPASCVGMAMEQGLQGVPGIFNPPVQGCQAMLLISSKLLAPFAGDPRVPVLSSIRRGFVAMEIFTALFAVFISYRQGICSGFEVFPPQGYLSAWNSAFKMGREA